MADYYDPQTLRGVIKKTLPVRQFFKSRFFNNTVTFPTESVKFEFQGDTRRLAPYLNSRMPVNAMSRDGYRVVTFTPPLIGAKSVITDDTLAQKLLGEMPYNSGVTPEERAAKIAAEDLSKLQNAIWRREEYMCARVKQDGKLIIKGEGVNDVVDYNFTNIFRPESTERWTSSFDILGYLGEKAKELQKNGVNPDMLILGSDATKALLDNNKVYKLLDNRRVEIGEIKPAQLEHGVVYLGRLVTIGAAFDLYTYNEWVPDENGELKPIIDPETVIMQSSTESNSMLYAAITIMSSSGQYETYMEEMTPQRWFEIDPPVQFLALKSRPLPMPHDLNSWLVLKGVVTGAE